MWTPAILHLLRKTGKKLAHFQYKHNFYCVCLSTVGWIDKYRYRELMIQSLHYNTLSSSFTCSCSSLYLCMSVCLHVCVCTHARRSVPLCTHMEVTIPLWVPSFSDFFFFFETWSLIPWNTVWNIFVTLYHSHNYKSLSAPIENGVVSAHTAVGTLFEPSNFVHIATVTQHPQERRVWRRAVKMKLKPSQLGCQPIKQRATVTQTLTKGNKKCKFAVFTGIVEKTRKKSSSDSFL